MNILYILYIKIMVLSINNISYTYLKYSKINNYHIIIFNTC